MNEALLEALRATNSPYLSDIEQSLASGRSVVGAGWSTAIPPLLTIYRRRFEHLARFRSPHAEALRRDVAALVHRLERTESPSCDILRVEGMGTPPHRYVMFFDPEEGQLLGCLATISRLTVSKEEWADLWGET